VVPVFELGEWHGDVFLVMELVSGTTLETWLKSAKRSRREIIRHFVDAGRGLAAAHAAGVVHRDFKPANVLVGLDGRVRVTDFGLSRPGPATLDLPPLASPLVTRDGALVGTVAYMSPEQLDGKPADERSDQFSFCVALVEALTGTRPFEGDSWSTLAVGLTRAPKLSGLPRQLRAVLRKGLSVEAGKRYTTMSAMLNALERSPQQGVMAVAALGVALAMAGVVLFRSSPEPVPATVSAPAPVPEETVAIEVAASDLEEGSVVTAAQFEARAMPARYVTSSNVKVEGLSYVLGHRLAVPVQKGDPLLWSAVASEAVDQAPQPEQQQYVNFEVGSIAKVSRAGVVRIAIGDPGVADPKVNGDTIELMGVAPGITTLLLFTRDGKRESWRLNVSARGPSQGAAKPAQVVTFLVGTIAKVTRPGVVRVAIGDPGVADPKVKGDTVELMGVGPGTTTLILFTKDGAKEVWTLRVSAGDPVQVDPKLPEQLSKQDVMETILRARSELTGCKTGTGAPVSLSLAWTVLPSGEVRDVRVDEGPADSPQAKCVLTVVENLEFPKAKKSLEVTFPFKF
jgi:hypothetical protein